MVSVNVSEVLTPAIFNLLAMSLSLGIVASSSRVGEASSSVHHPPLPLYLAAGSRPIRTIDAETYMRCLSLPDSGSSLLVFSHRI